MPTGLFGTGRYVIEAKTAAYYLTPLDEGKIFTNRGAGASVTFTLPPTTDLPAGWAVRFFVATDDEVVIASFGSSDDIIGFNQATGDTLTITTASEHLGAAAEFVWDGTSWLCFLMTEETQTVAFA